MRSRRNRRTSKPSKPKIPATPNPDKSPLSKESLLKRLLLGIKNYTGRQVITIIAAMVATICAPLLMANIVVPLFVKAKPPITDNGNKGELVAPQNSGDLNENKNKSVTDLPLTDNGNKGEIIAPPKTDEINGNKNVSVTHDPPNPDVRPGGPPPGPPPASLPPLVIRSPDWNVGNNTPNIGKAAGAVLEFPTHPSATLKINTVTDWLFVKVGGELQEPYRTYHLRPLLLPSRKSIIVKAIKLGFQDWQETIYLEAGQVFPLNVVMKPAGRCGNADIRPIKRVYPDQTKIPGIYGIVHVLFEVDQSGKVINVITTSDPDSRLIMAVKEAAMKWQFTPVEPGCRSTAPAKREIPDTFIFNPE